LKGLWFCSKEIQGGGDGTPRQKDPLICACGDAVWKSGADIRELGFKMKNSTTVSGIIRGGNV